MGLSKFKHLNSLLNLTFNLKSVFSICAGELREESVAIVCFSSDLRKKKKKMSILMIHTTISIKLNHRSMHFGIRAHTSYF